GKVQTNHRQTPCISPSFSTVKNLLSAKFCKVMGFSFERSRFHRSCGSDSNASPGTFTRDENVFISQVSHLQYQLLTVKISGLDFSLATSAKGLRSKPY